ncbi:MAG: beta-ketoacyl synthase N-terminal-like domain-containing protein [Candidatus Sumerlaeota bacterium]
MPESSFRDVYIIAASFLTALGDNEKTWQGLLEGRSAIDTVQRFDVEAVEYKQAACVDAPDIERRGSLMRGMTEACIDMLECRRESAPVFWAGVKSDVEFVEASVENIKDEAMLCCPADFRKLVARQMCLEDRGLVINAACASSTVAMALAADRISRGEEEAVVVAATDIVSRFSFMGFSALKALTANTCRPFDENRDGLCLGDGAVVLVMGNKKTARASASRPLGRITGWGIANDANHITGPARNGRGLISAIEQAMKQAGTEPGTIAACMAHGTGTVFNDAMELTAIESVFDKRRFPVVSVKGAIGHTLGAAGAIETALALRAMEEKTFPPTVGFQSGEARAEGHISPEARSLAKGPLLKTNSGFGGVNAALVLEEA